MADPKIKSKLEWGFAGPWYWELQQMDPEHGLYAKLKFLAHYGFTSMGMGIGELNNMSPEELDKLGRFLEDNKLKLHPEMWAKFMELTPDEAKKKAEIFGENVRKYASFLKGSITTSGAGAGHRFDRTATVEQKLEKLSQGIAPFAAVCKELGKPMAIENHGDYYCSDWVKLCQNTPDLYIFLDTGNTYLIGEAPVPAFEAAAPYTIGTHFKDHYVGPNPQILHFEIGGAPLGDGDVCLRECYDILMKHAPWPDKLYMEVEMVSPKDMNPLECMHKSIEFINNLKEG